MSPYAFVPHSVFLIRFRGLDAVDQLEALAEQQAPFGQTIFQLRTSVADSLGYRDYSEFLMKAKNL